MRAVFFLAVTLAIFVGIPERAAVLAQEPLEPKGPANALASESSPYLLMHAHNPVQWHAWNETTLALARQQDKPIFLSIGYSSCHWCHVMERESFLDPEISRYLNDHFICIKVDREERPDVDDIYMHALLAIKGGGGGWPLSMFLTPDAKPFFGGTYWPARDGDRNAQVGFLKVITTVADHFRDHRDLVEKDAQAVTSATRELLASQPPAAGLPIQVSWPVTTIKRMHANFDTRFGGFRFSLTNPNVPKFPEPSNLLFLHHFLAGIKPVEPGTPVDADAKTDREHAEQMLVATCQQMLQGGIHDHLGGGFHRYSVDRYWRIPHFEKMLYDNGQLATLYAEAFALTNQPEFQRTAAGILDFVERELTAPSGGFYSSLDAESEGIEGKFYRWTRAEIEAALTPAEYQLFSQVYGIGGAPNFEDQFYVPQLSDPLASKAAGLDLTEHALETKLIPIRQKLFDLREQRPRPLLDNKILTAWNGLMIRGFADGGRILKQPRYLQIAQRAADFALDQLVDSNGRLQRTSTNGEVKLNGYLIDYACLIDGLIALHKASGEPRWLEEAARLQEKQDQLFWDDQHGGYFNTSADHEVLIARAKTMNDGTIPSGNSVAAGNLWYLGQQLKRDELQQRARRTVLAASPLLTRSGDAAPRILITVLDLTRGTSPE